MGRAPRDVPRHRRTRRRPGGGDHRRRGAFCSGADLWAAGPTRRGTPPDLHHAPRGRRGLALHRIPQPTIAKVGGVAAGAGCNLALGCDLIVASDDARFSEIFARRGLSLDFGGSWLLPRLIGLHRAKEMALFADIMSAKEAEALGLVNRVVPAGELDAFVDDWAPRLAQGPPVALAQTKRLLNDAFRHPRRGPRGRGRRPDRQRHHQHGGGDGRRVPGPSATPASTRPLTSLPGHPPAPRRRGHDGAPEGTALTTVALCSRLVVPLCRSGVGCGARPARGSRVGLGRRRRSWPAAVGADASSAAGLVDRSVGAQRGSAGPRRRRSIPTAPVDPAATAPVDPAATAPTPLARPCPAPPTSSR